MTDNDIVILTMTPIIFYISRRAKINPLPYLIAQFFAANILSMTLYIGNPVNIVAADAQGIAFVEFFKWMLLPSFLAAVTCLVLLLVVFRRMLPDRIEMPDVDPRLAIKNKSGAVFGTVLFTTTIVLISLPTNLLGVPLWVLTSVAAGIMVLYDIFYYNLIAAKKTRGYSSNIFVVGSRMPWKVIPFVMGLFIIIESLVSTGWTDFFASHLSIISGSVIVTVLSVIFLSAIMANVMNNQPMTIFFVRIFQSPSFNVSSVARLGSTLALIAGANFGANFTLVGALAGIMWANILSEKGIQISFSKFSKYGLLIMPTVVLIAGLTLVLELMMWT
ncbi:MAG: SLC13 family permease [Methanobacteriota archaeon]